MEYVVRHYVAGYVAVAAAFVFVFSFLLLYSGLSDADVLWALLMFIPCAAAHEFSHYMIARRYNPHVKIRFLPKLGALVLDYVKLGYTEYVKVALTPLLTVELPLVMIYLLTRGSAILLLAVVHFAASLVDVTDVLCVSVLHRGGTIHLVYDERGRVAGILIEEPSKNRSTVYML